MIRQHLESIRAEALFVSAAQRSDHLCAADVRAAVHGSVRRLGTAAIAAMVAQEYGEHPDTACGRMAWALLAVRSAYPQTADPEPARQPIAA